MIRKLPQESVLYEFERYRLDLAQRVLLRDGQLIPLAPKAFDLLLALVEARGRVMSKEELLKRVWPGTFVEEGSLTQNISTLRKTLAEDNASQRYIQTIPKRGYRFVAPIRSAEASEPEFPHPVVNLEYQMAHDSDLVPPQARLSRWALMGAVALAVVGVAMVLNMAIESKQVARMAPPEQTLPAVRHVVDPAAYEAWLKGQYWLDRKGEANLRKGREYIEQAIEKDPAYAPAWAGLADAYVGLANWGVLPYRDAFPRARAAAERALRLDDSLVAPLVALAATKLNYEWDWAGAEQLCRRAIALNAQYGRAHHVYATYLAEVGRTQEAVAEARRARDVEPLDPEFQANVVWKLYVAHKYDEAESEARRIDLLYPRFSLGYVRASLYTQVGRQKEAVVGFRKTITEWGSGSLELMYLAHGLGAAGAEAEAKQVLDQMLERSRRGYVPPDYIAIAYEGLGQREQALQWYEKAFAERSINGWILPDPQLDPLRADLRFQGLLRKMGLTRHTLSEHLSQ